MIRRALVVVALLASHAAFAQTPPEIRPNADVPPAQQHFVDGKAAQARGDHAAAADHFVAAYDITKDIELLREIAGAYEHAGKRIEAAATYRRYLGARPDAADAKALEGRAAVLESNGPAPPPPPLPAAPPAPATQPTPPAPAVTPELPPAPAFVDEPVRWQRTAAWVSVGVAAVFLTTGGVLATSAASREEDLNRLIDIRDPSGRPFEYMGLVREDYEDKLKEGENLDELAIYSFIACGVAVTAATVFFILDATAAPKEKKRNAIVVPMVTPESAGVSAAWRF